MKPTLHKLLCWHYLKLFLFYFRSESLESGNFNKSVRSFPLQEIERNANDLITEEEKEKRRAEKRRAKKKVNFNPVVDFAHNLLFDRRIICGGFFYAA